MPFTWTSFSLDSEFEDLNPNNLKDLAARLARNYSEGKAAESIWLDALKFAEAEFKSPGSRLEGGKFLEAFETQLGTSPIRRLIQIAWNQFLELRGEGSWPAIKASSANAYADLSAYFKGLPEVLADWNNRSYQDRKWAALRMIERCPPLADDSEGEKLVQLIADALLRDMNKLPNVNRTRKDLCLLPPIIGDAKFFRDLGDALEFSRCLKIQGALVHGWCTAELAISAYPFCFWTDQAIADFVNEAGISNSEDGVTSRAIKSHRERLGLKKGPRAYVGATFVDPAEKILRVEYLERPRKNPGERTKAQ